VWQVLVEAGTNDAHLPAVQVCKGLSIAANDWDWVMNLGKNLPKMQTFDAEDGSFKGAPDPVPYLSPSPHLTSPEPNQT
jgi:hypothetical protein